MNEQTEAIEPATKPEVKRSHKAVPKEKPETAAIPPCPEEDPQAGDKTPAVVAWWFKHHPEEAALKYHGRKFQPLTDHE